MGKWKPEEDAKLKEAVKEHSANNWDAVAALVPGRTHGQCRYRWLTSLDPSLNRGRWTAEEDAKLTEAVTQLGNDWVRVAAMVPRRTNIQCRRRWVKSLDPDRSTDEAEGSIHRRYSCGPARH
jgi:myb proto-oncogene protein